MDVTVANAKDVIVELEEAYFDIPFQNSAFQTEKFVVAAQITPERAYRSIGLEMLTKLQTLQELQYKNELAQIDLDEYASKVENPQTDPFERRRAEAEIRRSKSQTRYSQKLLNDVLVELNLLYNMFKKFPKYTREQFEAAEYTHYEQRLLRQTQGISGAAESLVNMTEDHKAILEYQQKVSLIDNVDTKQLAILLETMTNKLEVKKV